jgi:GDPmannose 4,6-dehydratase
MKTAIITGISGQDGAYLSKLLLEKGYKVIGAERRNASGQLWRLKKLGIIDEIEFDDFELVEFSNIFRLLEKHKPDEFYNLAAQSFVAASFELPIMTGDVTGLGVGRILEAIRLVKPDTKFYQASSSEMFGQVCETPQNESTPFHPMSPYASAKVYGHWLTVNYRESYNMFTCSGILFNHESPLRGSEFVTKKITTGLVKIKLGQIEYLELGNLEARRDWGFAGDYVKAMHMMLSKNEPNDYVVSSMANHSITEFVEKAAEVIGIDLVWEGKGLDKVGINKDTNKVIIKINPKYFRPAEVDVLLGDCSKAIKELNWKPKTSFNQLVQMMVDSDMRELQK